MIFHYDSYVFCHFNWQMPSIRSHHGRKIRHDHSLIISVSLTQIRQYFIDSIKAQRSITLRNRYLFKSLSLFIRQLKLILRPLFEFISIIKREQDMPDIIQYLVLSLTLTQRIYTTYLIQPVVSKNTPQASSYRTARYRGKHLIVKSISFLCLIRLVAIIPFSSNLLCNIIKLKLIL